MPGAFKNRAVEALDELFSGESRDLRETYSTVLELLESDERLAQLTRRYVRDDGRWTGPELDHFEGHWLRHDSHLARLMKERYREAVDGHERSAPDRHLLGERRHRRIRDPRLSGEAPCCRARLPAARIRSPRSEIADTGSGQELFGLVAQPAHPQPRGVGEHFLDDDARHVVIAWATTSA